uniref:Uncharacterized protein n=1 Tax=Fusarium acutatum TaxID=78861 RepID=A0A6M4AZL5_9HYPO|nr:hypothetical protein [Fusarium acutatum]
MVREEWRLALLHCKLKAKSSKDDLVVIHLRGTTALVYSFSMRILRDNKSLSWRRKLALVMRLVHNVKHTSLFIYFYCNNYRRKLELAPYFFFLAPSAFIAHL